MAGADIHIVGGDLEMLAASLEGLRDGVGALDVSGPLEGVGTAMPGSHSSGRAGVAVSGLEGHRSALGGRYGDLGAGARELVASHQANDEDVAQGATMVGAASASSGSSVSVDEWARTKGLM